MPMTRAMYGRDDAKIDAPHVDQNRAFFYAHLGLIFLRGDILVVRSGLHTALCSALPDAHRTLRIALNCLLFVGIAGGYGGCSGEGVFRKDAAMTTAKLFVSTLTTCLLATLPLAAQESPPRFEVEAAAPAVGDPVVRLDFTVPTIGVAGTTHGAGLNVGVGVRLAHQSGHGVRFDFANASTAGFQILGSPAHLASNSYDLSYFHRIRLEGNDRSGIGLDVGGGLSVQEIRFVQGSGFWSPAPPTVAESVADGMHVGGTLAAALDGRVYGFVIGLDLRAHTTFALAAQPGDMSVQADLSLNLNVGFGFH